MTNIDIRKIVERFQTSADSYSRYTRYYLGHHHLAFATKKFENAFGKMFREFSLNLCPAVVDAVKDKLRVENFTTEAGDDAIPENAWQIWQRNRLSVRSGQVHKEALTKGDAYMIVWPNAENQATFYPQRPENCLVEYDDEMPGKIVWAAKRWTVTEGEKGDKKRRRINVYYADRVEKYQSKEVEQDRFTSEPQGYELIETVPNPFGIVPVFHFANNADVGQRGLSELRDGLPVQDALNKTVLDMMVAMEFAAFRQRWATGIEVEFDDEGKPKAPFQAGIERIWAVESPDAKFGDFEASDLEKFLKVKESFRVDMAATTGTPLYYFMLTSANFPSGESLKKSETRFINKVRDRQEAFGQVWSDAMELALKIDNKGKDVRLFVEWEDPDPLTESEKLENILIKKDLGISTRQALIDAGYGEADVDRIMGEREQEQQAAADQFNTGFIDDAE